MNTRTVLALLSATTLLIVLGIVLSGDEPTSAGRPAREAPNGGRSNPSDLTVPDSPVASTERVADEAPMAQMKATTLREILLEIAAAEEAIVRANESRPGAPAASLIERLERAVQPVLDERERLELILALLAAGPGGERQLGDRELYGAIRAVYWSMVVWTGRGDGRPSVLAILASLPTIHVDARDDLMLNIMRAAVDGDLVLDRSYLEDVLAFRSLFPEDAALFSELLAVIGETLTVAERDALFAVFEAETDDPVLAGMTIKNLLLGSDPDFGLFLAELRYDSAEIPNEVKKAIANAVVDSADVFSATSFLAERTDGFRNDLVLWSKVGRRTGGLEALEAEYALLAENSAHPRAREMLVAGMSTAPRERLLTIATTETEPRVIGQALLSATARRETGTPESYATTLNLLREHYHGGGKPGGMSTMQAIGVAANTARSAAQTGRRTEQGSAVSFLEEIARDRAVPGAGRRSAIESLRPYLSSAAIEALEESL